MKDWKLAMLLLFGIWAVEMILICIFGLAKPLGA